MVNNPGLLFTHYITHFCFKRHTILLPGRSMRQRMKTYPLTYEALYSGEPN